MKTMSERVHDFISPSRFLLFAFLLYSQSVVSQFAFPGSEGFGSITRGAYSGSSQPRILIVDNLDPGDFGNQMTGRGTLLWCIRQSYPRVIVFEVAGVIDYRSRRTWITIDNPFLTIAGQTSPGTGINIIGTFFDISTNDVIIQHLRFRHGDSPGGIPYNSRNGISILNASRVIIDHCTITWSLRSLFNSVFATNITYSNCLFAEPLHNSFYFDELFSNRPQPHGWAGLLYNSRNISLINNIIAFSTQRNPLTRADSIVIINNLMYNSGIIRDNLFIAGRMGVNFETGLVRGSFVGNVVLRTRGTTSSPSEYAGFIGSQVNAVSKIYVHDNICVKSLLNPTIRERDKFLIGNSQFQFSDASPVDLTEYDIRSANEVEAFVLENAGAKHLERDDNDQRIIENIRNKTGEYINCINPLPARVFNWSNEGDLTSPGFMVNGFDWASKPTSVSINGTTVQLNKRCNSLSEVLNHINPQLSDGVEAYVHEGGTYIGFRTQQKGSAYSLTVQGSGLSDFGIVAGTYYGDDGIPFPNYSPLMRSLDCIFDYPSEKPHEDEDGNGFTNLQEWLHLMSNRIYQCEETMPAGPEELCQGIEKSTYTTTGVPEEAMYIWKIVPDQAGTPESSGKSTVVSWNQTFAGYAYLSYTATRPDGYASFSPALTIYIKPKPPKPGLPSGEESVTQPKSFSDYQVDPLNVAEDYEWVLSPSQAGELSPLSPGNLCRIYWEESFFGTASISVRGSNSCGYGPFSPALAIEVKEPGLEMGIINLFTPNGDGINDLWNIPFIRDFPEARIQIFDRNNRLIVEYRGTDNSWDGTSNGVPVPMGNYLYIIDFGSRKKPVKGYVTILR